MQVSHRFVKLSEQDSGKQHLFTWRDDDGNFLCHTMYQSGADTLDVNGAQAGRGQVLRVLTKEITEENEKVSAPSMDSESGTLRFQVEGNNWGAAEYSEVAKSVTSSASLNPKQRCAVMCQLGALYNLMATQYGKLFDNTLSAPTYRAVDNVVTDAKLRHISRWFASKGAEMLAGKMPDMKDLDDVEASPIEQSPAGNVLSFSHGIVPRNNQKIHTFAIKDAGGADLITAEYQSGSLGETIVIEYPLRNGKHVAVPFNLMILPKECEDLVSEYASLTGDYEKTRDEFASLFAPVGEKYHLQKLDYYRQMYDISPEQQAATLLMLGSVTRLFATRFQRGFEPVAVTDSNELSDYINTKDLDNVSRALLTASATLLRDGKLEYPHLPIGHSDLGTGKAIEDLPPGVKTLDNTFQPFPEYWFMLGKIPESLTAPDGIFNRYQSHVSHGPGNYAVKEGKRK